MTVKTNIKKADNVNLKRLLKNPKNLRVILNDLRRAELIASLRAHGVQMPLIGYETGERIIVVDGNRRLDAAPDAGLEEVPVVVLDHEPNETELLLIQLTVNEERQAFNPVERYEGYIELMRLNGWTPTQLATNASVNAAKVSRTLSLGKLSPEERELVRSGKLSDSGGYALARLSEQERKPLLAKIIDGEITRDELNNAARRKKSNDSVKTSRIQCPVSGGSVSVRAAAGLSLGELIKLLENLVKECKKAHAQNLDIATAVRVLRDRCRTQAT